MLPDDIVLFLLLVFGDSVKVLMNPYFTGFFQNELFWIILDFLLLFRFWEGFGTNLGAFWGIRSYWRFTCQLSKGGANLCERRTTRDESLRGTYQNVMTSAVLMIQSWRHSFIWNSINFIEICVEDNIGMFFGLF